MLDFCSDKVSNNHDWGHNKTYNCLLPAKDKSNNNSSGNSHTSFKQRPQALSTDSIDDGSIFSNRTGKNTRWMVSIVKPPQIFFNDLTVKLFSDVISCISSKSLEIQIFHEDSSSGATCNTDNTHDELCPIFVIILFTIHLKIFINRNCKKHHELWKNNSHSSLRSAQHGCS